MMFAPIYVPEAPAVSRAVLQREAELLARDGQHHVGEAYFPNAANARTQRRWQAELEVRAEEKERQRIAGKCSWCERRFQEGEKRVDVGLRNEIHETPCQAEYEQFAIPKVEARRTA